ncbi:hypothetical protein BDF21DRAFT_497329 [Thamnidium elegans]|nr:hypothetical protein BDF21DRAFT_497329 [Thamnidium elegans]
MTKRNFIVTLDLGGTVYRTTANTLIGKSQYFSNRVELNEWGQKETFIDRDGFLFRYISLYLRTGELDIEKKHWKSVKKEAEFYQIPTLVAMLHEMINKEQPKKTVYKLSDEYEFSRFSNIDINSSTGNITDCTAVGSGKRFITSIQCDTTPYKCPPGIHGFQSNYQCGAACNEAGRNRSSKKNIMYLVSTTE